MLEARHRGFPWGTTAVMDVLTGMFAGGCPPTISWMPGVVGGLLSVATRTGAAIKRRQPLAQGRGRAPAGTWPAATTPGDSVQSLYGVGDQTRGAP